MSQDLKTAGMVIVAMALLIIALYLLRKRGSSSVLITDSGGNAIQMQCRYTDVTRTKDAFRLIPQGRSCPATVIEGGETYTLVIE